MTEKQEPHSVSPGQASAHPGTSCSLLTGRNLNIPELLSTLPPDGVHLLRSFTRLSVHPFGQCPKCVWQLETRFGIQGLRNEVCWGTEFWPQEGSMYLGLKTAE